MLKRFLILVVVIFTTLSSAAHASNREAEEDAFRKGFEATYKQSGLEERINELIDRNVPKKYRELAAQVAPVARVLINHEVEYKWEF